MSESQRKRRVVACDVCRGRRTKCDGRRPSCGYCSSHSLDCVYRIELGGPRSRLELDVADIHKRLDHITSLLTTPAHSATRSQRSNSSHHAPSPSHLAPMIPTSPSTPHELEPDSAKFPLMIIQSQAMMRVLGLSPDTGCWLVNLERTAVASSSSAANTLSAGAGLPRMFMLQPHLITTAVAAFSEHVHTWYPLFSADFSETFAHTLSNTGSDPIGSCLTMLVIAIGSLTAVRDTSAALKERPDLPFYEAAVALLPAAIQGYCLPSLQCLVLFAVYQLCLLRPCQAHDYISMASFRAQNMLRSRTFPDGSEQNEGLRRAFWTILLVESELLVQLDLPQTGIWAYEDISLPATTEAWRFNSETDPPHTSPPSHQADNSAFDSVMAYFLTEIAMRRMLQRCTTSVSKSTDGRLRYAPLVATELELQLNEWYKCLPPPFRFHTSPAGRDDIASLPAAQFLQTQYFACKASIYWPAVYQAIDASDDASGELLRYCAKFFDAYVAFVFAAEAAVQTCFVNTWTLNSSLFIIGMAARSAITAGCLQSTINDKVQHCLELGKQVVAESGSFSPSLAALSRIMNQTEGSQYRTPSDV